MNARHFEAGFVVSLRRVAGCALVFALVVAGLAPTAAQLYPHLRIIVPSNPGGAWDTTARAIQPILSAEGIARVASVENIPGAGGLIGLARFVSAELGNSDVVMVSGATMTYAIANNRSLYTWADVTPIARLLGESLVVIVPAKSPIRSLPDLIEGIREPDLIDAFRKHPESISWAVGGLAGTDQMVAWLIADAVGVDPRRVVFVAYAGGGEMMPAVLGGQVSVGINVLTPALPYIDAGSVRVLGVSSPDRLPSLNAPTLREQGVEVEFENWRALVAPPGISPADRQRLEAATAALVRSSAWSTAIARYGWNERFLSGPAFAGFLVGEEVRVREMVRKLGTGGTQSSAGSGLYPVLVLTTLAVMVLIVAHRRRRAANGTEPAGSRWRGVLLVGAGVLIDIVFIERMGFILTTTALFWMTARAFDGNHPPRDAGWAAALSLSAYVVFARLLDLPLPVGVIERWL